MSVNVRVRFQIIRNAKIYNVGKSQSCMVLNYGIYGTQTVVPALYYCIQARYRVVHVCRYEITQGLRLPYDPRLEDKSVMRASKL